LLHNVNSIFSKSKIIKLLEKSYSSVVCIIRDHDTEWNVEAVSVGFRNLRKSPVSACKGILSIVLEIAVILCNSCHWEINLDARVSKSFA